MRRRTLAEIETMLAACNPEALTADGFESAFIGMVQQFTHPPLALYDRDKCLAILMRRDGMSAEDAEEFFSFNTEGAWMGEQTPMFAVLVTSRTRSPA